MPFATNHHSSQITKIMLLGDSGTGKTGSLASLVKAGYNLRIADFDNGTDILINKVREYNDPKLLDKIHYVPLTDPIKMINGRPTSTPRAWTEFGKILSDWPDGFGNIEKWGPQDILVVDSLTFAGKAAVRFVLGLQGRLSDLPQLQDYGQAQDLLERMLAAMYAENVKCNVIVLSHITEFAREEQSLDAKGRLIRTEVAGTRRAFGETGTGKALSRHIGRYFNAILATEAITAGTQTRYVIKTQPYRNLTLKTTNPAKVKPEYSLTTGLAEYFEAVRQS